MGGSMAHAHVCVVVLALCSLSLNHNSIAKGFRLVHTNSRQKIVGWVFCSAICM